MERERYFEAKEFKNIKEIIYNSAKEFANNVAFIIKHKKEKEVEYENITYKKLLEDINSFGAKLYKLGFKNIYNIDWNLETEDDCSIFEEAVYAGFSEEDLLILLNYAIKHGMNINKRTNSCSV